MDWRLMMSSDRLRAVDLLDQPRVVTITRVVQGSYAPTERGKKPKKMPDIFFREYEVPLGCNSTNAKAIAKLLGSNNTDDWIGRAITIYPVEVDAFGEMKLAVRVQNRLPKQDPGPQRRAPAQQRGQQAPQRTAPQQHAKPPIAQGTAPVASPTDDFRPPPPDDDELAEIARRDREDA